MPRLQILQHKSYHPYLEKNKQRVREDEARAAAEELAKEQKRVDTEAEARLEILRRRAGSPSLIINQDDDLPSTSSKRDEGGKSSGGSLLERHRKEKAREEKKERKAKARLDFDFPTESEARRRNDRERDREREREKEENVRWESGGHVNLFADLERDVKPIPQISPAEAALAKKKKEEEDRYTMYLSRPDRETKPWYADKELKRVEDKAVDEDAKERRERERRKDERSKLRNDPLTQITSLLSTTQPKSQRKPQPHSSHSHSPNRNTQSSQRIAREQSERERALALIAKSKAPPKSSRNWDDTPSTIAGGGERSWAEDWERQKNKASHRFFGADASASASASRSGRGRSWEI